MSGRRPPARSLFWIIATLAYACALTIAKLSSPAPVKAVEKAEIAAEDRH